MYVHICIAARRAPGVHLADCGVAPKGLRARGHTTLPVMWETFLPSTLQHRAKERLQGHDPPLIFDTL